MPSLRRRLLLLAALLLVAAGLGAPPAQARGGGSSAADEHRRIVEYWTPAREASAVPRDVSPNPRGKPGGGGGGGGGSVLGASWTASGSVAKTTGKVFFTLNGVNYVCSGSAVAGAPSLVLTAGHCVHHGGGGAFATNWKFVPGYDNGVKPYGDWTATALFTTAMWAGQEDGFDDDAGFAIVTNNTTQSLSDKLTTSTGSAVIPTIDFDGANTTFTYSAFGYPAAQKYKGQKLIYCQGKARYAYDDHDTYALPCDMTGGSSGGPWIVGPNTTGATIRSLNSYGYASVSATMFGPVFGGGEEAAYNDAIDGCETANSLCWKRPLAA